MELVGWWWLDGVVGRGQETQVRGHPLPSLF